MACSKVHAPVQFCALLCCSATTMSEEQKESYGEPPSAPFAPEVQSARPIYGLSLFGVMLFREVVTADELVVQWEARLRACTLVVVATFCGRPAPPQTDRFFLTDTSPLLSQVFCIEKWCHFGIQWIHGSTDCVNNSTNKWLNSDWVLVFDKHHNITILYITATATMLPFETPTIFEQLPRFIFKMPRVVTDQKSKFESDELFRRLSRESEVGITLLINIDHVDHDCITQVDPCFAFQVRFTGYRDRPLEERQIRFQNGCREGHTEAVSVK